VEERSAFRVAFNGWKLGSDVMGDQREELTQDNIRDARIDQLIGASFRVAVSARCDLKDYTMTHLISPVNAPEFLK
jgi:hypothetical protein